MRKRKRVAVKPAKAVVTPALKDKAPRWRKALLGVGVGLGVLAGVSVHKLMTASPSDLMQTQYAAEAMPVLRNVSEKIGQGKIRSVVTSFSDPNVVVKFDHNTFTLLFASKHLRNPQAFLSKFHDSLHALHFSAATTPLHRFMYDEKKLLTRGEVNKSVSIPVSLMQEYVNRFVAKERRASLFLPDGHLDPYLVRAEWLRQFKEEKFTPELACLTEIHANLFDADGLRRDEDFYKMLCRDYASFSNTLSLEKFKKIKRAINGLYYVYAKTSDVHVKLAEFLGKNGMSFNGFLSKAKEELIRNNVSDADVANASEKRIFLIREAMQACKIPLPIE